MCAAMCAVATCRRNTGEVLVSYTHIIGILGNWRVTEEQNQDR